MYKCLTLLLSTQSFLGAISDWRVVDNESIKLLEFNVPSPSKGKMLHVGSTSYYVNGPYIENRFQVRWLSSDSPGWNFGNGQQQSQTKCSWRELTSPNNI